MPRTLNSCASTPPQVFQFKITLLDAELPVWRRIQSHDCTLDKLHEHIQTAMGWTNSHLHQFEISGRCYGDPALLSDGAALDFIDSTKLRMSQLLKGKRAPFRFHYEYDFGDRWRHQLDYECACPVEPGIEYPRCFDGAYACPPENVGGPRGYVDFLAAIRDAKHEDHADRLRWVGGRFDPEAFEPRKASTDMRLGLPKELSDESHGM